MIWPSRCTGSQVIPWSSERLIPAALVPVAGPNHEANTNPSVYPPPTHGLSGAVWIVRTADHVAPLSVDVIIRMLPSPALRSIYSWQTAYSVPAESTATLGSPTNNEPCVMGMETLVLQCWPPSADTEKAQT